MNCIFIGFESLEDFLSSLAANAEIYLFSHSELKTGDGYKVENFLTLAEVRDGGRCNYFQAMTGTMPFTGSRSAFNPRLGHARTTLFKRDIRADIEALGKGFRIVEAQVAFPANFKFVRGTAKAYRLDSQTDLFVKIAGEGTSGD